MPNFRFPQLSGTSSGQAARLPEMAQPLVGRFQIERFGVKTLTQPVQRVVMARMGGILKRFQIVGVAPNTSAVFPGTSALSRYATRIMGSRLRWERQGSTLGSTVELPSRRRAEEGEASWSGALPGAS